MKISSSHRNSMFHLGSIGLVLGSVIFLAPRLVLANDALTAVCRSDPLSIKAMLDDPLLAEFFELTCGLDARKAAENTNDLGRRANRGPQADAVPSYQDPEPANRNRSVLSDQGGGMLGSRPQVKPAIDPSLIQQPDSPLANDAVSKPELSQAFFKKFRFEGQIEIGQQDLAKAVAPLMGQAITRDALSLLAQSVAKTYRDLGWLVTVHLPSQDVSEGLVTLQIKEARFVAIEVSDPQGVLRNTSLPKEIVTNAQPLGEPVNLERTMRAQTQLNEIPGVIAQLNLKKGEREGDTEAVVQVTPNKPVNINIAADNSGSRSTGAERLTAGLVINNPTRRGDQFSAQLMGSEGLKYASLSYSVPVTSRAWRVGARISGLNYSLVSPDYAGLDAKGPTASAGLFAQLPILLTPRHRVRFDAAVTSNRFKHELNSQTYSKYTSDVLSAGWVVSTMNLLPGTNQSTAELFANRGRIDLSDSTPDHQRVDAATVRTEGYFTKVKLGASHRQWLTSKTSVYGALRGQWADKNLDGSERFSLGGSGGVRAYPTGEASGSLGGIASVELQHREPFGFGSISLAGFYDYGEIEVNAENNFLEAPSLNRYSLKGYGVWLGSEMALRDGYFGLRFTWARRDGENPAGSVLTGLDHDGTLDRDRYWLDAYYRY